MTADGRWVSPITGRATHSYLPASSTIPGCQRQLHNLPKPVRGRREIWEEDNPKFNPLIRHGLDEATPSKYDEVRQASRRQSDLLQEVKGAQPNQVPIGIVFVSTRLHVQHNRRRATWTTRLIASDKRLHVSEARPKAIIRRRTCPAPEHRVGHQASARWLALQATRSLPVQPSNAIFKDSVSVLNATSRRNEVLFYVDGDEGIRRI